MLLSKIRAAVLAVALAGCGRVADHQGSKGTGGHPNDTSTDGSVALPDPFVDVVRAKYVKNVDVLFVIENSPSMADKQGVLEHAVPDLVQRLVSPTCITSDTGVPNRAVTPPDPNLACPPNLVRELGGAFNIHVERGSRLS